MSSNDACKVLGCFGMIILVLISFGFGVLTMTVGYGVSVTSWPMLIVGFFVQLGLYAMMEIAKAMIKD